MLSIKNKKKGTYVNIDLAHSVGYPLKIKINTIHTENPLFWVSFNQKEIQVTSKFLESPSIPLELILTENDLAVLTKKVKKMLDCVPYKKYQLLQALLISKQAVELAESNPLLFIILVDFSEKNNLTAEDFKSLVLKKRHEILNSMGMVASKSTVRLLSRICISKIYGFTLMAIKRVFSKKDLKIQLCHVHRPTIAAIVMIYRHSNIIWPSLLNMFDSESSIYDISKLRQLADDCIRMGANLKKLRTIQTKQQLTEYHDALVEAYNGKKITEQLICYQKSYGNYPSPPLEGTEQIQPLTSWEELVNEGMEMSHCVSSYHNLIFNNRIFIYKVFGEKRLTLAIQKFKNRWVNKELAGLMNSIPSKNDNELVATWLAKQQ